MTGRRDGSAERAPVRPPTALIAAGSDVAYRQILEALRQTAPEPAVLPPVPDGVGMIQKALIWEPDLLLLDLEMPRLDGLTILRALGRRRARRTIVLAPGTREGGRAAWSALTLGARDLLPTRGRPGESRIDLEPDLLSDRLRSHVASLLYAPRPTCGRGKGRRVGRSDLCGLDGLVFLVAPGSIPPVVRLLANYAARFPLPVLLVLDLPPRFLRAIGEGIDRSLPLPVRRPIESERMLPREVTLVAARQRVELHRIGGSTRLVISHRGFESREDPWDDGSRHAFLSSPGAASFGLVLVGPAPDRLRGTLDAALCSGRLFRLRSGPARRGEWGLVRLTRMGTNQPRAVRI